MRSLPKRRWPLAENTGSPEWLEWGRWLHGWALAELGDTEGGVAEMEVAIRRVCSYRRRAQAGETLEQFVRLTMKKRGVELRLVIQNEPSSSSKVDTVLLKTIARAHRWFDQLLSGEVKSLTAIATREGLNYRFVGKIIRLALLAPEIVEAIAEGRQPPELSTELLTKRLRLPLDWGDQKRLLNI